MKKLLVVLACVMMALAFFSRVSSAESNLHGFVLTEKEDVFVLPGEEFSFSCFITDKEKEGFEWFSALNVKMDISYPLDFGFSLSQKWSLNGYIDTTPETIGDILPGKEVFFDTITMSGGRAVGTGTAFMKIQQEITRDKIYGDKINEEIFYTVLSNSGEDISNFLRPFGNRLFSFNTQGGHTPIGYYERLYVNLQIEVIDQQMKSRFFNLRKAICKINGLRGDVNGDRQVDNVDLQKLSFSLKCFPSDLEEGRFTSEGLNYGRGIVLFSRPDLLSTLLINIWIHDSDNPLVQGLGIGQLMSEYKDYLKDYVAKPAGPTIVRNMPFESKIEGNRMVITTQGHAVNVMAYLPDGKLWQDTKWTENGKAEFEIPDPKLDYKIESTWIPGKASVQTSVKEDLLNTFFLSNHPNPFNPSTTINFSLPKAGEVVVEVYNISGQKVATLARGYREAGKHSLVWNANSFSAGIYFCIIRQGSEAKKLKMTLVK